MEQHHGRSGELEVDMNTKRVELHEVLPLETPFSIHAFVSFYCNFKCNYCLHCLDKDTLAEKGFKKQYMNIDIFKKMVDDVKGFNGNVKALLFAGHGEPLLHPEIAEMVAYAKKSGKFDRIEIVTNGSLLSHELSDKLIDAGLDRLRISLQGVNAEDYMDVSKVNLDFDKFVEQISYFCNKKKATEVYIKIIDVALKRKGDERRFHEIFDSIADITAIEYAIPFVNEIDYDKVGELSNKCKQGNNGKSSICSMPFYMMVLNPDGKIVPCCATDYPMVFGDINNENIVDIWNSKIRNMALRRQLNGVQNIPICKECTVPEYGLQVGDYLDDHKEELLERYEAIWQKLNHSQE